MPRVQGLSSCEALFQRSLCPLRMVRRVAPTQPGKRELDRRQSLCWFGRGAGHEHVGVKILVGQSLAGGHGAHGAHHGR